MRPQPTSLLARQSCCFRETHSRRLAYEVRRVINAPRAFVSSDTWVRTQWSRAINLAVRHVIGNNPFRCDPFFYPVFECGDGIETIRSVTTTTMFHPGNHEEAQPVRRLSCTAHCIEYALVVVDGANWTDRLITPPVVHQELSTF